MEKIVRLKQAFEREKIDGYFIPKNDQFFGEYIPNYNDRLNYISNFSGSYGFALILKDKNYLFVDGRYTLQAHSQSGKNFEVVTFPDKMPNEISKKKLLIGFDPKLSTKQTINIFFKKNKYKFVQIKNNLIDEIWKRQIKENKKKYYTMPRHTVGSD